MVVRLVGSVLILVMLAGCFGNDGGSGSTETDPDAPLPVINTFDFDGQGAYEYVEGLVMDGDQVRYRVPGGNESQRAMHAAAADWLEETMASPGWDVSRQSFTGADYRDLDHGPVGTWASSERFCLQRDSEPFDDVQFHNLIATYPGPKGSPYVILGAHWDSKEEASAEEHIDNSMKPVPGANDGASGVGVLIQLMNHVSNGDLEPRFGLMVVLFDGEDGFEDCHPLAGSLYHAQNLDEDVSAMILLDMVGDRDARFVRETRSAQSAPEVVDLIWGHAHDMNLHSNFINTSRAIVDDHVAYIEEGIPAVDIVDYGRDDTDYGFPPYWHTTRDDMTNIDYTMLADVGGVVSRVLQDPAFAATL